MSQRVPLETSATSHIPAAVIESLACPGCSQCQDWHSQTPGGTQLEAAVS